jgi:hypothetical protein
MLAHETYLEEWSNEACECAANGVLMNCIETEEENQRVIAELERLDTQGRSLTREEEKLAELMALLVRQFENERLSARSRRAGGSIAHSDGGPPASAA